MEVGWRLQEFPICFRSNSLVRLAVLTEKQQQIIFEADNSGEAFRSWKTTLRSWFYFNKRDKLAKNLNYINIPQCHVFNYKNKAYIRR